MVARVATLIFQPLTIKRPSCRDIAYGSRTDVVRRPTSFVNGHATASAGYLSGHSLAGNSVTIIRIIDVSAVSRTTA